MRLIVIDIFCLKQTKLKSKCLYSHTVLGKHFDHCYVLYKFYIPVLWSPFRWCTELKNVGRNTECHSSKDTRAVNNKHFIIGCIITTYITTAKTIKCDKTALQNNFKNPINRLNNRKASIKEMCFWLDI